MRCSMARTSSIGHPRTPPGRMLTPRPSACTHYGRVRAPDASCRSQPCADSCTGRTPRPNSVVSSPSRHDGPKAAGYRDKSREACSTAGPKHQTHTRGHVRCRWFEHLTRGRLARGHGLARSHRPQMTRHESCLIGPDGPARCSGFPVGRGPQICGGVRRGARHPAGADVHNLGR